MNRTEPSHRILVIDDTPAIHDDFRKILAPAPFARAAEVQSLAQSIFGDLTDALPAGKIFSVDFALQGEDGYALARAAYDAHRPYMVAFVDMRMPPGWDGLETIAQLWKIDPELQVVICTAYSDHNWSSIHAKLGQTTNLLVLKKPFDHVEVFQLAHSLCEKWSLHRRLAQQVTDLDAAVTAKTADLALAEERFRLAFNASALAQCVQALDDGRILEINQSFARQFNISPAKAAGLRPETIGHGTDPERWHRLLRQLVAGHQLDEIPFRYIPDGEHPREMRASARSLTIAGLRCAIWVIRDVTQQLQSEQQLRQVQKLEAIGQLAAGIAHDFNNILTIILSYADPELYAPPAQIEWVEGATRIRSAAERAAALTRQLLVFSRQQIPDTKPINLSQTALKLREMLHRLIPSRIKFSWSCPSEIPIILADTANIEQIILNLVVNARDAIAREGEITVGVAPADFTRETAQAHPARREGPFLCLSVSDTGTGIPPAVLPRIFDPFFTTKEVGQGTGLGLATVYSIVQQHHGWIEVKTSPAGTRFDIYFPISVQAAEHTASPFGLQSVEKTLAKLKVLYVEDDAIVANVTQSILTRYFASVTAASDGPSARALWQSSGGDYDFLLTDMVMPHGVSGADLAHEFTTQKPALKVLITSGYSARLLAEKEGLTRTRQILTKPYNRQDLLRAIGEIFTHH